MFVIKNKLTIVLTVSIFLILPGLAFSEEKSFIIGFHQKPGPSEDALIQNAKGKAKSYQMRQVLAAIERLELENG